MTLVLNGTTGVSAVDGSASTPAIQGNDSNTGVFFPAADTVAIATGGVERFRVASDGAQSSVIPSGSTLYPAYDCRAWVNFNGTGTVAIRGSGNVSSITDNGVGNYTVNLTTAMPDGSYSCVVGGTRTSDSATDNFSTQTFDYQTNTVKINTFASAVSFVDAFRVTVAVFR